MEVLDLYRKLLTPSGVDRRRPRARTTQVCLVVLAFACSIPQFAVGQTAHWIWAPQHSPDQVPIGPVHFRKRFKLVEPIKGELVIAADDEFQVYLNGHLIGYGQGYEQMAKIDMSQHLLDGDNLLAIRATNTNGSTGAMSGVMRFQLQGESVWRWLATDASWKSATEVMPEWKDSVYNDANWPLAQVLEKLGNSDRWDAVRLGRATSQTNGAEQTTKQNSKPVFQVPDQFDVQRILDSSVGSIIAMEFNEFGQLILSQEGGKLLLADLSDSIRGEINIRTFCDQMQNVQGILPLNGDLLVTGSGPQGLGLYRLSDANRDGMLEATEKLVGFTGEPGEHGPHGLAMGPDGMIYVSVGNASALEGTINVQSPIQRVYEGDLIPRVEDPGGHAVGVKAPGGIVARISLDGKQREIVASGLRNAYDLAFNGQGDLFFHDSDMESDIGTPWYRPTQVYHLSLGGEYGWRSGSAKFPEYFLDKLPAIADTGRGSPTGAVVYDHTRMPLRYHGALFLGDWSEGRILAIRMTPSNGTYHAEVEEFLKSQPLPVTDLAVGPDGSLYFCTGGRGTAGGVYRVSWTGKIPESFTLLQDRLSQVIRRPQPQSAWTRQQLAKIKVMFGEDWTNILQGVMNETRNEPKFRARALEMMLLFGPVPSTDTLIALTSDVHAEVRLAAVRALAWRFTQAAGDRLLISLEDPDARVQIAACQSLAHIQRAPEWNRLQPLLASENREVAFAARRLLETIAPESWRDEVLSSRSPRVFAYGAIALLIVEPTLKNSYDALAKVSAMMEEFVSDRDFVDLLRVVQIALQQGNVEPERIPLFCKRIDEEFPAGNGIINRELSRVLGHLKTSGSLERLPAYLANDSDTTSDKFQVLMNLRGSAALMSSDCLLTTLAFLEGLRGETHEGNYNLFVAEVLKEYSAHLSPALTSSILQEGDRFPTTALEIFFRLPESLDESQIQLISDMDRKLKGRTDEAALQARIGVIAVLARSGDDKSMYYLREVWRRETDRRNDVVLGLAQKPDGPNWSYLITSFPDLTDDTATEVLKQLKTVDQRPKDPQHFRQVIFTGYRLRDQGAGAASDLLEHWSGSRLTPEPADWRSLMNAWSQWFARTFPNETPISLEEEGTQIGGHSTDDILSYLEQQKDKLDLAKGRVAFTKAQCNKCHRYDGEGESMGPDLSTLANRFSPRETLEAIAHPSNFISDRYRAKKVLTTDGEQIVGLLSKSGNDAYVILEPSGVKRRVKVAQVDEIADAETSAMPEGLVDKLSLQEITELLNYLYVPAEQLARKASTSSATR